MTWRGGLAASVASVSAFLRAATLARAAARAPLGQRCLWSCLGCSFKVLSPTGIFLNLGSAEFIVFLRRSEVFHSEFIVSAVVKMCLASARSKPCVPALARTGLVLWNK